MHNNASFSRDAKCGMKTSDSTDIMRKSPLFSAAKDNNNEILLRKRGQTAHAEIFHWLKTGSGVF